MEIIVSAYIVLCTTRYTYSLHDMDNVILRSVIFCVARIGVSFLLFFSILYCLYFVVVLRDKRCSVYCLLFTVYCLLYSLRH